MTSLFDVFSNRTLTSSSVRQLRENTIAYILLGIFRFLSHAGKCVFVKVYGSLVKDNTNWHKFLENFIYLYSADINKNIF